MFSFAAGFIVQVVSLLCCVWGLDCLWCFVVLGWFRCYAGDYWLWCLCLSFRLSLWFVVYWWVVAVGIALGLGLLVGGLTVFVWCFVLLDAIAF